MRFSFTILKKFTFFSPRIKWSTRRRWLALISFFALSMIGLFVWSGYLYMGISDQSIFDTLEKTDTTNEILDRGAVRSLAEFFDERSELFERYKDTPPSISDPSR